ncbi:hypothetical protein M5K25_021260 [Dendrobium thyrsiflorum]|uniref:RNase H type-1 domain-containing protein n=1 Tax=Dendrobium thyrsiflorum TaxID=117978 RepID=A0ABD0UC72_DENTH
MCRWECNMEETTVHCTANCMKLELILSILDGWGFCMPRFHSFDELLNGLRNLAENNPTILALVGYIVMWFTFFGGLGTPKCMEKLGQYWLLLRLLRLHPFPNHSTCQFWSNGASISPLDCLLTNYGIVVRNSEGNLIVPAGWLIEHLDITQAEFMASLAIKEVIQDWMLEVDGIIIEGDSLIVVKWLQDMFNRKNKIPDAFPQRLLLTGRFLICCPVVLVAEAMLMKQCFVIKGKNISFTAEEVALITGLPNRGADFVVGSGRMSGVTANDLRHEIDGLKRTTPVKELLEKFIIFYCPIYSSSSQISGFLQLSFLWPKMLKNS